MQNYLYKLKFQTPVHFGSDKAGIGLEDVSLNCHADTFFSALCNEILSLYGENELEKFIKNAEDGKFLISDLFPYKEEDLYLPKPAIPPKKKEEDNPDEEKKNLKKKFKKLTHISVKKWDDYIKYLKGDLKEFSPEMPKFAEEAIFSKVSIPRTGFDENGKTEKNKLFSVGAYIFEENCGLYFIASIEDKKQKTQFDKILNSLGYSGIGGKRTSGYGKFELHEDPIELDSKNPVYDSDEKLAKLFENKEETDYFISLSCIFPSDNDLQTTNLKNGFYTLIQRQGFVYSSTYSDEPLKRKPIYMLNVGSCFFKKKLEGSIPDVSENGKHSVYRYGKALMIGI